MKVPGFCCQSLFTFKSHRVADFFQGYCSEIKGKVEPRCALSSKTGFIFFTGLFFPLHGFPVPNDGLPEWVLVQPLTPRQDFWLDEPLTRCGACLCPGLSRVCWKHLSSVSLEFFSMYELLLAFLASFILFHHQLS